jgi:hypothetical protein
MDELHMRNNKILEQYEQIPYQFWHVHSVTASRFSNSDC